MSVIVAAMMYNNSISGLQTRPQKPWFTIINDNNNCMCCSTPVSTLWFNNPIFGTKCAIQNITQKTKSEIIHELREIKELQPITNLNGNLVDDNSILYNEMQTTIKENDNKCLNYIYDFICDQNNKNVQTGHIKYCSKCGKCYKMFHYVVNKWWNIPYYSELHCEEYK
jgi:hypothetical protein